MLGVAEKIAIHTTQGRRVIFEYTAISFKTMQMACARGS